MGGRHWSQYRTAERARQAQDPVLARGDCRVLTEFAQIDARIVGYAIAGVSKTLQEGEIMSLYLLPEAIGHGIGSQLLRQGLAQLRAFNMERAYAWCLLENPRALAFYESHGAQRGRESSFSIEWDVGLLGSAVARPQTTVGGQDAYPTIWLKAAALLQSIVNNHALVDGNKRLGWLATAVFLELDDASVAGATNDDVYDLVITVASTKVTLEEIAARLESLAATTH